MTNIQGAKKCALNSGADELPCSVVTRILSNWYIYKYNVGI